MSAIKGVTLCVFVAFVIARADVEYERTGACNVS